MTMWMRSGPALTVALVGAVVTLLGAPRVAQAALRVCADPGNMPLSNNRGEGLENKMAEVLAGALGTTVTYYYRPGVERGLTRTTLYANNCDVMLDMPPDSERRADDQRAVSLDLRAGVPQRSRHDFKSLDDPRLKKLKVGVYETSAMREALLEHGVTRNVAIHYLSHDADLVPKDQPSYQVQEVIDGTLDVAAVWGPMAGYYKAVKHAALTIATGQHCMDDTVPLEFDMAIAVRRNDHELRAAARAGDARASRRAARDPDRLRRAAGAMRQLHDQRRSALARAVRRAEARGAECADDADR